MRGTSGRRRLLAAAALSIVATLAVAGCGSPQQAANPVVVDSTPYKVGLVYSQTGAAGQLRQAVRRGLQGRPRRTPPRAPTRSATTRSSVTEADDAGDPAKAVTAAKDLIGKGVQDPGRFDRVRRRRCRSPRSRRRTRCCSSPGRPRPTRLTGINKYTFRSGRQSYQDVLTAKSFIGDAGRQEGTGVRAGHRVRPGQRRGGEGGHRRRRRDRDRGRWCRRRRRSSPPFAKQALDAEARPALRGLGRHHRAARCGRRWTSRACSASTTVVTGLDIKASWPTFGAAGDEDLASWRTTSTARPTTPVEQARSSRPCPAARSTCSTRTASPPRR